MILRKKVEYDFLENELEVIKLKMLNWLQPFSIFNYLDNNNYEHQPNRFELLAACGQVNYYHEIPQNLNDWLFGHIAYDYKNEIYKDLKSESLNSSGFPNVFFYQPELVLYIPFKSNQLIIECLNENPEKILKEILSQHVEDEIVNPIKMDQWKYRFTQEEYLQQIHQIRNHIEEGDCYELNFCMEAYITNEIDPLLVFKKLNKLNPSPFAAFYKMDDQYLICASPERYIYKNNNRIISQPIKGTIAKQANWKEDIKAKENLFHDEKERAENVMITDLVRNDLAICAQVGSVKVTELFGVYSFPTLHHLISTIEADLKKNIFLKEIINATFPMGSMTGAPKKIVMEIIEELERSYRGIFSGALGYIMPNQDFDFNVVIRSLVYNQKTDYLSYQTGGAITYDSIPEKEWEEVQLKAKAMQRVFLDI